MFDKTHLIQNQLDEIYQRGICSSDMQVVEDHRTPREAALTTVDGAASGR
jgi:hypothetical protein